MKRIYPSLPEIILSDERSLQRVMRAANIAANKQRDKAKRERVLEQRQRRQQREWSEA